MFLKYLLYSFIVKRNKQLSNYLTISDNHQLQPQIISHPVSLNYDVKSVKFLKISNRLLSNIYENFSLNIIIINSLYFRDIKENASWFYPFFKKIKLSTLENFFFLSSNSFKKRQRLTFNVLNILYNSFYFSTLFKMKIKYKVMETTRVVPQNIIIFLSSELSKSDWRTFGIKHINLIINMLITAVWVKNLDVMCKFFKQTLNSYFYKEHKKFFKFFFYLFNTIIWPFRTFFNVKGIYFQFRGKLARGGNKRKTVLTLKKGLYSLSSKSLRMTYNKWSVWTKTGSMGCVLYLFYINDV